MAGNSRGRLRWPATEEGFSAVVVATRQAHLPPGDGDAGDDILDPASVRPRAGDEREDLGDALQHERRQQARPKASPW
jgi:hypothetical protein